MPFATTQNITVNEEPRAYVPAWDKEFEKDIAAGNTKIRKCDLPLGNSAHKVQHSETKSGIERHVCSVRDKTTAGDDSGDIEQVQLVVTFNADDPAARERARLLVFGFNCAINATGWLQDFLSGSL